MEGDVTCGDKPRRFMKRRIFDVGRGVYPRLLNVLLEQVIDLMNMAAWRRKFKEGCLAIPLSQNNKRGIFEITLNPPNPPFERGGLKNHSQIKMFSWGDLFLIGNYQFTIHN
jgi:hypothetical protein